MVKSELFDARQGVADDVNAQIYKKVAEAVPVEVLSTHGNKLLQVVEDSDGSKFVTRSFTQEAVDSMAHSHLSFEDLWFEMNATLPNAGIDVLPNHLLPSVGEYPYVAVSPYLADGYDLKDAPTEVKVDLATAFGKLYGEQSSFVPSLEMLSYAMFMAAEDEAGQVKAFLVDIEPRLKSRFVYGNMLDAMFVRRLGDLFWDYWCKEDERPEVLSALVKSLSLNSRALGEDFDPSTDLASAFMDVHLMSNGVDTRDRQHISRD